MTVFRSRTRWLVAAGCVAAIGAAAAPAAGFQPVDISVSLSEKAAATLRERNEGIVVSASYSGEPTAAAKPHADEIGRIDLGTETHSLAGSGGSIQLGGPQSGSKRLDWIQGPVLINVNVFSARKSSQDNLLSCDFIDGPLPQVAAKPVALNCSLIDENKPTRTVP